MLDKQSTLKCIKTPALEKFSDFTSQEKDVLKAAIIKVKFDQLCELSTTILAVLDELTEDSPPELIKKLLGLITQSTFNAEQLNKSASIILEKKEIDQTLKDSLKTPEEIELYVAVYNARHQFYLDKPSFVKDNKKAFPERMSERLLHKGHKHVSRFLNGGCSSLNQAEKSILAKAYPLNDSQNNEHKKTNLQVKTFRREAHLDIGLTLEEIQILITSQISKKLLSKVSSSESLELFELSGKDKIQYELYTKAEGMNLIAQGKLSEFKEYLHKNNFSMDEIDLHSGLSFLCYAIKQKKLDFVSWLLSQGAKVDLLTHERYSPLHFAAEISNPAFTAELLKFKPQLDVVDRGGYTPIYVAAELGKASCVNLLVYGGADPNLQNNRYRNTPLHAAVRSGKVGVIQALAVCNNVRVDLPDKKGDTVLSLAKSLNNPEVIKILEESNNLKSRLPANASLKPPALVAVAKDQASSNNWTNILRYGALLVDVKEQSPALSKVTYNSLQAHMMPSFSAVGRQSVKISPKDLFQNEHAAITELEQKFISIASSLQNIVNSKATFAQAYQIIFQLLEKVITDGLSPLRFAEELCRFKLLKHLEELQDNKTVLQVAIDGEELDVITTELTKNPDQQALIHYKGEQVTVLNYAILLGKTQAVKALLDAMNINSAIMLGAIPPNALQMAEENQVKLQFKSAALKEADDYFNIDIPAASKANVLRMLHELRATLPKVKKPIHYVNYMFLSNEYNLVKFLLNDKKDERPTSYLRKLVVGWIRLNRIEKASLASSETEPETMASLARAKKYLSSGRIHNRHISLAVPDGPKITNIYRHATKHIKLIEESGTLETVQSVLNASKIALVSTPEGSRNNIFLSPPGSELTSLRSADSGIVEVDMAVAIDKKLLSEDDFYTSPHFSAYRIEKVETATVFVGENPNTKTIYRVYHTKKSKIYIFEYYQDGVFVGSKKIEKMMHEEFFMGNNMRMLALRMVLFLRHIAGPLKGSYTDYFYKNCREPKIINSLKRVLFDVMHVEGKIARSIKINHEAVKIVKNDNPTLPFTSYYPAANDLIRIDALEKFEQMVKSKDLKNDDLRFAVSTASFYGRRNFLEFLMLRGIPINFNNSEPLRRLIIKLEQDYIRAECKEDDSAVQNDLKMLELLLYQGTASTEDPSHIRNVSSGDNFSDQQRVWGKSTTPDLLQIAKFIFRFKQISIQKLLLNSVYKHLEGLYKITATYGYYDLHNYIADRIGAATLFAIEPHNKLIGMIDKENTDGLVTFLSSLPSLELGEYYYLLTNAIIRGKEKVVEEIFPVLKSCELESLNTGFSIALEYNQPAIAKKLIALGASYDRPNILGELPIEVDPKTVIEMLPYDYIASIKDIPAAISSCIIRRRNELVAILCKKLPPLRLADIAKALRNQADPSRNPQWKHLSDTIEFENTEAFEILVRHHAEGVTMHVELAPYYSALFVVAVKTNKINILQSIFKIIEEDPKLPNLIFGSADKLLSKFEMIFLHSTYEVLAAVLLGIRQLSKKRNMLESSGCKNILQMAVATGKESFVRVVLQFAPNLKFITDSKSAGNFYKYNLFGNHLQDEPAFLKFLFDRGLPKPSHDEQVLMLMYSLSANKPKQIRWLFENEILDAKFIYEDNKNMLQMAVDAWIKNGDASLENLYHGSSGTNSSGIDAEANNLSNDFMDYLFKELPLNPGHADQSGKTLLHYDSFSKCKFARNFKEYLVANCNLNLNKFDSDGNCILNATLRERFYLIAIEKYLKDGGDIKKINNEQMSFLESQLVLGRTKAIITKLTELGLMPRKCVILPFVSLHITTCYFNDKLYVLKHKASNFFLRKHTTYKAYSFILKNQRASYITLGNDHRGVVNELPIKVSKNNSSGDYEWVEADKVLALEKSNDAKQREEIIGYNLTCLLLKYISNYKNLPGTPEPGHLVHDLSEEDSRNIFHECTTFSLLMRQAYSSILQGLLPTEKEATLLKAFVGTGLVIQILTLNEDGFAYTLCDKVHSPFELAIRNRQVQLLANLYKQGYSYLAYRKNRKCFKPAFLNNDIRSLEVLFDHETVTGNFISNLIPQNVQIHLVEAMTFLISKLSTCKGLTPQSKDMLVTRLRSIEDNQARQSLLDALEQACKKPANDQPAKLKKNKVSTDDAKAKEDLPGKKTKSSLVVKKERPTQRKVPKAPDVLPEKHVEVERKGRKRTASKSDVETNPKQQRPSSSDISESNPAPTPIAVHRNSFFIKLKRSSDPIKDGQNKSQKLAEEKLDATSSESSSSPGNGQ